VPKLSGLINDRELAICGRVGTVRHYQGWQQVHFAQSIGITRDNLVSIEYGRTPLRFWLADRICEKFNISQQWLATGRDPVSGYVVIPQDLLIQTAPRSLFSAAFDDRLGHFVQERIQQTQALARAIAAKADASGKILEDRLYNLALCWFQRIPPHLYQEYFSVLMAASSAFFQQHRGQFAPGVWPPPRLPRPQELENTEKKLLPEVTASDNVLPVKQTMANLLERLNTATSQRGTKSKLAKAMGVPLANVSQWLSGVREPGGETTLRLLEWVRAEEAEQKSPDSATTPAGQKTQVRKSGYEKQTQVRNKR